LLRIYPAEVYEAMTSDGLLSKRMNGLLRHIGCVPVSDITVMLVCMSPVSKMSHSFAVAARSRWVFLENLSRMTFLLKLVQFAADPTRFCWVSGYVSPEEHTHAALQVLQELVEKFSLEENGEILLQPLGYCYELLDILVNSGLGLPVDALLGESSSPCDPALKISVAQEMPLSLRRIYIRSLCYLLKRSANVEIVVYVGNPGGPPTAVMVRNTLYPLRPRMLAHLQSRIPSFCDALMNMAAEDEGAAVGDSPKNVTYPGHVVSRPFSSYRMLVVEFLVLMIEADKKVAQLIPLDLWKLLINWVFTYAHNNIYHSLFYRILFSILR
jgi:hypothetical protein